MYNKYIFIRRVSVDFDVRSVCGGRSGVLQGASSLSDGRVNVFLVFIIQQASSRSVLHGALHWPLTQIIPVPVAGGGAAGGSLLPVGLSVAVAAGICMSEELHH